MKKYLQISVVILVFGAIVLFRQLQGQSAQPVVGTPTPSPSSGSSNSASTRAPSTSSGSSTGSSAAKYKDGTYIGSAADAFYGIVQVQIVISGGKITDVVFLQQPNDNPTTRQINTQATPLLRQEAITAQSAQVDIVSGASQTSSAFQQSLSAALQQAS